jgi:hypothetical protein
MLLIINLKLAGCVSRADMRETYRNYKTLSISSALRNGELRGASRRGSGAAFEYYVTPSLRAVVSGNILAYF